MIELLAAFAVWRITSLLYQEDGPWGVFEKIRKRKLIVDCFWCLSLWVSIPFAIILSGNVADSIVSWLGLSGIAVLINVIIDKYDS